MSNALTLATYEECAELYIERTSQEVAGSLKKWLDAALLELPTDAKILEIGSGGGRDASYIESLGYTRLTCSDAADSFVQWLLEHGHVAAPLNILTEEIDGSFDLILADAVFLHFTPEELQIVLGKCLRALNPGGSLAFTVKTGEGSEITNDKLDQPRFFQYWGPYDITRRVIHVGFVGYAFVSSPPAWIHLLAFKSK